MLKYDHVFNSNVDFPFHIHVIESNTTSVSINLNNSHIGYFEPTIGSAFAFSKYIAVPDIFSLMVVGTRQDYDRKTHDSIFKDSTVKYIRNLAGDFLVRNNDTGLYYWSTTERTRFFFNPYYFNSTVLWEFVIGYVPAGTKTVDIWSDAEAKDLFLSQFYEVDMSWVGEQAIADVTPIVDEPFTNETSGTLKYYGVDGFIEELQDLVDGDIIKIDNGVETIEVQVGNCFTDALYQTETVTTRPIAHVDIDIINPNKKYVYSRALAIDQFEAINLNLYDNVVNFTIERIPE